MCTDCVIRQEEVQRQWLSVNFPIPPFLKQQVKKNVLEDRALSSSDCACRGLRVMTLSGIPAYGVPRGCRGTVVFEEADGIFVIRWDTGKVIIHERNFYLTSIKELGYAEFEQKRKAPRSRAN